MIFVLCDMSEVRCHSQVLLSQSDYFKGLLEFKANTEGERVGPIRHEVTGFPKILFCSMIEFFYLGETKVESEDLVDLLQLCQ